MNSVLGENPEDDDHDHEEKSAASTNMATDRGLVAEKVGAKRMSHYGRQKRTGLRSRKSWRSFDEMKTCSMWMY